VLSGLFVAAGLWVREFLPISVGRHEMVGWNYAAGYGGDSVGRRFAAAQTGADAGMSNACDMKTGDLVDLLNGILQRERARRSPATFGQRLTTTPAP